MTGSRGLFGRLRGGGGAPPPPARPGRVQLAHVGFVGKVPSVGDFIARGVPSAERGRFEAFLNAGLRDVANQPGFAEAWSVMPIWRFAARPGAITQAMCLGVVLPSVDRVGRRFPLAVLALAAPGADADPDALLTAAAPFLAEAEAAALKALDPSAPPEAAFAALMQRRDLPSPAAGVSSGAACVWETDGGRTGAPARLPSMGPPPPAATLAAMLAAAGDPQAAMATLAAQAAVTPAAAAPPAEAPPNEAPLFAQTTPPPLFGQSDAPRPIQGDEAPLFPETTAAPSPAPPPADEQVAQAQDAQAVEDNVFAAAYQSLAAESSTQRGAPGPARRDDQTGASAPPEGAPRDGGETS